MKILRLKRFSKYPKIEPFDIPDEWDGLYNDIEVDISNCEELFDKELPLLVSDINKKRAKKMKKEMESSPIFLFFDGPTVKNEETHALVQFSNDEVQVWSKSISTFDRLVYDG